MPLHKIKLHAAALSMNPTAIPPDAFSVQKSSERSALSTTHLVPRTRVASLQGAPTIATVDILEQLVRLPPWGHGIIVHD